MEGSGGDIKEGDGGGDGKGGERGIYTGECGKGGGDGKVGEEGADVEREVQAGGGEGKVGDDLTGGG